MFNLTVVIITITAAIFAVAAYAVAKNRGAARLAEQDARRRVAEENSRLAKVQAEELRAERDRAQEQADRVTNANSELSLRQHDLEQGIVTLTGQLEATRNELRHTELKAEQLRAEASSGQTESTSLASRLRTAENEIATLRGKEQQLVDEVQRLRVRVAELDELNQGLQQQAVALEAVRQQVDTAGAENLRLQQEAFQALGDQLLARSEASLVSAAQTKLAQISEPVRERLALIDKRLEEFEVSRTSSEATLRQEIKGLSEESLRHRQQTHSLVQALKRPETRGRWGEMHLERAVELAGLHQHCDFDTQVHIPGVDVSLRPDMIVHLVGGKHVVVDSKVPMDAFVAATEADSDAAAGKHWVEHAKQVRRHIDGLAEKEYFRKVGSTPEFVIMFVPSESFLAPALERDRTLLEYAAAKQVLIVTPVTLIAALRAIAFGWKQEALRENLRQVLKLGTEIYERLSTMGGHVERLGSAIDRAVKTYNDTVGSLESRVLVTARKLRELSVASGELPMPQPKDKLTRPLGSVELLESAAAERLSPVPQTEATVSAARQIGTE
ncbi:DNA recombination protein RmuC [Nocardia tenerifensis]|uniref:DNA recombination protein RmuC n=1 Tax=Nocardia tenerifensis TaxID=228006 RepID=A0A318JNM0_9NOCA|nr:DNA recombination protein RmuC [Nocardia tenerifensis]PXX53344.1 DNA recombination protein RmuC [Nocardia tenerifensis]